MTSRHVAGLVLAGACALCIFFLAPPPVAQAYDCTTIGSGEWSDKSTWDSCNGWYPGPGDTATINDGHSVYLTEDIQVNGLTVAAGGALDLNYNDLTVADGAVSASGLSGAGTLYTTGTSSLYGGSGFAVAWEVASGTTTAYGGTDGPVTVASGAILHVTSPYLVVYGDMTVNGKVTGAAGAILSFCGASFTNNGEVLADDVDFSGAGTQTIGGGGPWAGDAFSHSALTLVLAHDLSLAYNSYDLYNTLSLGAYTLTASGGVIDSRGAVTATTGRFRTTGAVELHGTDPGTFSAALEVSGGTTTAWGDFLGPVTVAGGATLRVSNSYDLELCGNVTVNGTLSSAGSLTTLRFRGSTFTNAGQVSVANITFLGSTQTIAGAGSWTGTGTLSFASNTPVALANDVSMAFGAFVNAAVPLNLQGHTLTFTTAGSLTFTNHGELNLGSQPFAFSAPGGATFDGRGTVNGTGEFRTSGAVSLTPTSFGVFNPTLRVLSGTTTTSGTLNGSVVVNGGATLRVAASGILTVNGEVTVYGALSGGDAGSTLVFRGTDFTNEGAISVANMTWSAGGHNLWGLGAWSGAGAFTIQSGDTLGLANDVTLAYATYANDGTLDLGAHTLTVSGGAFTNSGAVSGGTFRTTGTTRLTGNNRNFAAAWQVASGTTTASGTTDGPVTVAGGATLSVAANRNLELYGSLTVNGTLTGDETATFYYDGASFTNNGMVSAIHVGLYGNGAQTLAGAGTWSGAIPSSTLYIGGDADVTLANNILLVYGSYTNYGEVALGAYRLTVGGGGIYNYGAVTGYGGGVFRVQGNSDLYGMTDDFTAALEIYSGTTIGSGRVDGPVTVANAATLQVEGGGTLSLYDSVTVAAGGALSGALYDELWFYGHQITNNGTISANTIYINNSIYTMDGTGAWTGAGSFNIWPSGSVTLPSGMTLHFGAFDNRGYLGPDALTLAPAGSLTFSNSGRLALGSQPFSFAAPGGATFNGAGGTVEGPGEFRTSGTVGLTTGAFTAPLHVLDAVTTVTGAISSPVTVDGGADLHVPAAGSLSISGSLTNDGTVSGGAGASLFVAGGGAGIATVANSGVISVPAVTLYGPNVVLQGAGVFSGNATTIAGSGVDLGSSHVMSAVVVAGEADFTYFDLNGYTLTLTGTGAPLTVNHPGGLRTAGSTISYFSTTEGQQVATTNVAYHNLTIANAAGVTGASGLAVTGLLYMAEGAFTSGCAAHDVLISAAGVLNLSGDCTVGGDFTNYNSFGLIGNGHTVAFNGSGDQHLAAHAVTFFDSLTVDLGVTLIETEATNYAAASVLTNRGVIRKTQAIAGTGAVSFGLTGVQMNVTTRGALSSLQVDRIDSNHPNAAVGVQTGRYWTLTPSGSGYTVDLLLPHAGLADPTACRYTGSNWDCGRTSFEPTFVRRDGITALSAWAVGRDIQPAAAPHVDIGKSGSNVVLSWTNLVADAGGYLAWRSGSPYFTPGPPATSVALPAGSTGWTHTGGAGNPSYNWYYVVQGINGAGVASGPSNRTGTFSFSLAPGTQ